MDPNKPLRVAVIGAGAFGRNHARVYHQLQQERAGVTLAGVIDSNRDRAEAVARDVSLCCPDLIRLFLVVGKFPDQCS